jgi:signal transduction histidine kinase
VLIAYLNGVSVSRTPGWRLPAWTQVDGPFGICVLDVGIVALVIALIEINVVVGGGYGAAPLNAQAYLLGAVIALPLLFRRRWPLRVLQVCFVAVMLYYTIDRRNISPAPLLFLPVYDAALAGYLAWAIAIPAIVMTAGLIAVGTTGHESAVVLASNFLPSIVLFVLAVMLGEVVRGRRALAAETARRLALAEEERAAEAGRLVAEERLRIARELHDTVAHSMATIAVQAASALHLLNPAPSPPATGADVAVGGAMTAVSAPVSVAGTAADASALRAALTAIRATSKSALGEMRSVLGQLRSADGGLAADLPAAGAVGRGAAVGGAAAGGAAAGGRTGLDRLAALRDAVCAAGTQVTVHVEGDPVALPAEADHAAYRILQESLTNVLRHAGLGAAATVCLRYRPGILTLTVSDDGTAPETGGNGSSGHGIHGMRERATAVGGTLSAGRGPGGGFEVTATLPTAAGKAT